MVGAMKLANYLILLILATVSFGADIEQVWTISLMDVRPDGVLKRVPVVNGLYPGPELRGRVGQSVKIEVRNELPDTSTTIHWHGIKQTGTVSSDGVPDITQCPIEAGETYTYEFVLDAPGTLWWHSHSDLQKSSLYGAIIIEGDEHLVPRYDEERTLLLNDWFHQNSADALAGILSPQPNFALPTFNSLLINGKGEFNCSSDLSKDCDPTSPDAGPFVLNVDPQKTYRLRIVGAATDSFLNFGIEGHRMRIIEVETTLVRPHNSRFIDVNAGQSYSVLLQSLNTKQLNLPKNKEGKFWMQLNVWPYDENLRGFGVLQYSTAENDDLPTAVRPEWSIREDDAWSLRQARRQRALRRVRDMPRTANRVFTVLSTVNIQDNGRITWAANNISFAYGGTPILHAVKLGIESETSQYVEQTSIPTVFDYSQTFADNGLPQTSNFGTQVIKVEKDEVVDMVFQNAVIFTGAALSHPWHLHLHNFWVLGYGDQDGSAWTPNDAASYDMARPVSRNTFNLFGNSWTAIRVKFDNPGIAFMHCHINPHLAMGMALSIQIGDQNQIPELPRNTKLCGTAL